MNLGWDLELDAEVAVASCLMIQTEKKKKDARRLLKFCYADDGICAITLRPIQSQWDPDGVKKGCLTASTLATRFPDCVVRFEFWVVGVWKTGVLGIWGLRFFGWWE